MTDTTTDQDHIRIVFLCEQTGQPMTDAGFCPVHRADGCLAAYKHHRNADEPADIDAAQLPDVRATGYLHGRAEWATVQLAEPDDEERCERCLEDIPTGAFFMRFVALADHELAECWDAVSECRDCASQIGFGPHFDGLPLDASAPSDQEGTDDA